jgi:eukaryotic-like serine/threonine-protein kinase
MFAMTRSTEELDLPRLDLSAADGAELRLDQVLGSGGMGEVRLARQRSLSRDVAVKRPLAGRDATVSTELLLYEGVMTGRLEHPNIVPVHMLGVDADGRAALVMKRVEGVPWSVLIDEPDNPMWANTKSLSVDRQHQHLELFLEVCTALDFAHGRGIVHRDVKPANVMVGAFGEVYLLDWGIATAAGTPAMGHLAPDERRSPLGTPGYMAPEMMQHDGVIDQRTDVYLLGASLHRALTGQRRHQGADLETLFDSVARSEPYDYGPDVPRDLAAICNRATAQAPSDRYPDVASLRDAVVAHLRRRGSIALTEAALGRLASLEQAVADSADEGDVIELAKLSSEARFGFLQALREWNGNDQARSGLQRCIGVMARQLIARGNVEAARALVAELPAPDPVLDAELADAIARRAAERERVDGLERMADDLDERVSWRARIGLFLVLSVAGSASGLLFVPIGGAPLLPLDNRGGVVSAALVAVVLSVFVYARRRQLLKNAANRRIVGLVYASAGAMMLNRTFALFERVTPALVTSRDLLLFAVSSAIGALAIDRRLGWSTLVFVVGGATIVLWPDLFLPLFAGTTVAALVAVGLAWTLAPGANSTRTGR